MTKELMWSIPISKKLIAIIAIAISYHASAHYLWIEIGGPVKVKSKTEIKIYYGEYNEGVREVRGGRLEELAGIDVWLISPDGQQVSLPATISEMFFQASFIPQKEGRYLIVAVNKVRDVVDWSKYDIGVVRPAYYASRELEVGRPNVSLSAQANFPEQSELSVMPLRQTNTYKITFKGKPLVKSKVLFHAPNEWSKELSTDENGVVSFDPLWKGQYVIECIYNEKRLGEFKGKQFEAIRHRATQTVIVE